MRGARVSPPAVAPPTPAATLSSSRQCPVQADSPSIHGTLTASRILIHVTPVTLSLASDPTDTKVLVQYGTILSFPPHSVQIVVVVHMLGYGGPGRPPWSAVCITVRAAPLGASRRVPLPLGPLSGSPFAHFPFPRTLCLFLFSGPSRARALTMHHRAGCHAPCGATCNPTAFGPTA